MKYPLRWIVEALIHEKLEPAGGHAEIRRGVSALSRLNDDDEFLNDDEDDDIIPPGDDDDDDDDE